MVCALLSHGSLFLGCPMICPLQDRVHSSLLFPFGGRGIILSCKTQRLTPLQLIVCIQRFKVWTLGFVHRSSLDGISHAFVSFLFPSSGIYPSFLAHRSDWFGANSHYASWQCKMLPHPPFSDSCVVGKLVPQKIEKTVH